MTAALLAFTIALTQAVDPVHDHSHMAEVIADVVASESPLFADDEKRERTAAIVIAVAWREGSLRERIEGDCDVHTKDGVCVSGPHSFCTAQIHDTSGGTPKLNDDPALCVRTEIAMLRVSIRVCREAPLAFYAAGPRGFKGERALRLSRDRMALAGRLRAAATASLAKADAQ